LKNKEYEGEEEEASRRIKQEKQAEEASRRSKQKKRSAISWYTCDMVLWDGGMGCMWYSGTRDMVLAYLID
jgi:hypothetical protein